MRPPRDAVMLLLRNSAGSYLFVRRHPERPAGGYWCPVSGRVEAGETLAEAAVREATEEVGLEVEAIAEVTAMASSSGEYLLHWWFVVQKTEEAARVAAPDEITEVRWVHPADLPGLTPTFPEDVAIVQEFEAHGRHQFKVP